MPTLGLGTLTTAIETALKAAPQLDGVHVTQEFPDEPTADMCPGIIIQPGTVRWDERIIVARDPASASAVVHATFSFHCMEFSAQSVSDSASRRDTLLDNLIAVLRRNRQVGNVLDLRITGIEPLNGPPFGGMFSAAILTAEAEKLV